MQEVLEYMEEASTNEGGAGNGEDPCADDAARDSPADSGEAACGADTDNGAGDGVRGADGDAEVRRWRAA